MSGRGHKFGQWYERKNREADDEYRRDWERGRTRDPVLDMIVAGFCTLAAISMRLFAPPIAIGQDAFFVLAAIFSLAIFMAARSRYKTERDWRRR